MLNSGMMVCQLGRLKTESGQGEFKWRFQLEGENVRNTAKNLEKCEHRNLKFFSSWTLKSLRIMIEIALKKRPCRERNV